ncbi:MAG: hypothetical protein KGI70_01305 [Patescibacteria group bacterium]|nr:hypothetical protein [Patescibacteria group bacterium]
MQRTFRLTLVLLIGVAGFLMPAVASAQVSPIFSFGGTVITENFCIHGAINIIIKPAGFFPISYVWGPTTVSVPPAPLIHPGQQVLGLAAPIPILCIGFGLHPPVWAGFQVLYGGASSPLDVGLSSLGI